MRVGSACVLAVAIVLAHRPSAHADEVVVRTLEHGDWASAVAAMQLDPNAQGRVVQVVVESRLTAGVAVRTPCGRYFLLFDAPGQRAFRAGTCDPETHATPVELVDRAALFELDGAFARPRTMQIAAFTVRQGTAQGQARAPAGTDLRCAIALEPYVVDLLRNERVRATPEHFALRPLGEGARIETHGQGWVVRASSVRFDYELIDRRSGAVVLRESVAMTCRREPETPALPRTEETRPSPLPEASLRGPIERVLESSGPSRHSGRCGGEHSPEHTYTLEIEHPIWLSLRVESRFDAAVYLRNAAGEELDCSVVRGEPGQIRLPRTWAQLAPGTYTVVIDAAGPPPSDGWYRLAVDFLRLR